MGKESSSLPLKFVDGTKLKIREDRFAETKDELEEFLSDLNHLHTKAFAKSVLFSHEIKANNQVEGYNDDVKLIKDIIERKVAQADAHQKQRVLNLYRGYNFILKENIIDEEALKALYAILSKDLLEESDSSRMGDYYRQGKVYILQNGRLDQEPDEGIDVTLIPDFMKAYFEFLNDMDYSKSLTDEYIKSQILHFYFVYIHPYFDVNGRTSRTMAMWYLLNKNAYPYIIFNRGISFSGNIYDKAIIDVKKFHDISYFIDYMLKTVQIELEKEYIMQSIASSIGTKLSSEDYQTMLYMLSMNGLITVSDYVATYNRFHAKKRAREVYETMIDPLLQKGIINVQRQTNSFMFDNTHNEVLNFNDNVLDYDRAKIRRLEKYK